MKNFIALFIFAGGITAWFLYQQKTEMADNLKQSRALLAETEVIAEARRADFQKANAVMLIQQKLNAKEAELKQMALTFQAFTEAKKDLIKEKQTLLATIRQKQVGKTISLTLINGRILGEVRITKADDSGLSVAMSSGVLKISPQELPDSVKKNLGY